MFDANLEVVVVVKKVILNSSQKQLRGPGTRASEPRGPADARWRLISLASERAALREWSEWCTLMCSAEVVGMNGAYLVVVRLERCL